MVSSMRADLLSGPTATKEQGRKEILGAALLKHLAEANTQEGNEKGLTDDELLSNVFVGVSVVILFDTHSCFNPHPDFPTG